MPASAALSKQNEASFSKDRTAQAAADLLVQTQGIAQVLSRELGIPAGRSAEFYTGRDFQATPCSTAPSSFPFAPRSSRLEECHLLLEKS